jgi:hypothetical protein
MRKPLLSFQDECFLQPRGHQGKRSLWKNNRNIEEATHQVKNDALEYKSRRAPATLTNHLRSFKEGKSIRKEEKVLTQGNNNN